MTGSLKDRLAAKAARRIVIPIGITEPGEAQEALLAAKMALTLSTRDGEVTPSAAERKKLTNAVDAAQKAYDDCFVDVPFTAVSSSDYEALMEAHARPDPGEDEELIEWDACLPELVAASCEDPELRDPAWWREQFAKDTWSTADKMQLRFTLERLNMDVPVKAGKG